MDFTSFIIGVVVAVCVILALPWALSLILEAINKIKSRIKGGGWVVKKIKETSSYSVYDEKDNLLKSGFKDLEDAYEYAVNVLIKGEVKTVKIKGEITIKSK